MITLELELKKPTVNFSDDGEDDSTVAFPADAPLATPAAPFEDEEDFISNPGEEDAEEAPKKKVNKDGFEEESLEELASKDDLEDDEKEEENY